MYGKVFTSIFDSSLVAEGGWLPTYIFMSMITIADKDGIVSIAPKALYRRLGFREYESKVTFEEFSQAIAYLESEDEESNSSERNGRRIVSLSEMPDIDGCRGWFVVNYLEYRKKGSREMPGASTERVRKYRNSKNNDLENGNDNVTTGNGRNGHTDTDTDTDRSNRYPANPTGFEEFWQAYPRKKDKKEALKRYRKLNPDADLLTRIMKALDAQKKSNQWQDPQFIPLPSTWLSRERWDDETEETPAQQPRYQPL